MHSTCLFPSSLQEIFVMHNTWTDAENYLLVEKLVSKTEEEAWKEVAEKCDGSGTYETESYKCKAIRKYAIYNGLAVEAVTLETVQSSPAGLVGWAEMNVVVPGIDSTPKPPATPQAAAAVPSENAATEPEKSKGKGKNKRGRGKEQESQEQSTRKTPRTKAKKELSGIQTAEASAKEILQFLQWASKSWKKLQAQGTSCPPNGNGHVLSWKTSIRTWPASRKPWSRQMEMSSPTSSMNWNSTFSARVASSRWRRATAIAMRLCWPSSLTAAIALALRSLAFYLRTFCLKVFDF